MARVSITLLVHGSGKRLGKRFRDELKAKTGKVSKSDEEIHFYYGESMSYH